MCPRVGKKYQTSLGNVKVLRSNFFKKSLSLLDENFEEQEVSIDEWNEIVNKPPSEEAKAEAKARTAGPKGRRGGRRPARGDDSRSDSGRDRDESGQDVDLSSLEDSPQDNSFDAPVQEERKRRPRRDNGPKPDDSAPKPAGSAPKADETGSGDNDSGAANKRGRRPRRRRRRPPRK